MDKASKRKVLLDLLDEHNAQEVIFIECNGCDTCDKIISIGKTLFTSKEKRRKQVRYGSVRKNLFPFFEEYGYHLSFKEANKHKKINCSPQQYYQLRKEYRESEGE